MSRLSRRQLLAAALLTGGYASAARPSSTNDTAQAHASLPWHNWSGWQSADPAGRFAPANEEELIDFVTRQPGPLRPVGAGHSFSGLVPTDGHLIVLDRLAGLRAHDATSATFGAGTRLADTGPLLENIGQAMINLPDIDRQTLAGAISTATHGTGVTLQGLSAYVSGIRLVTPAGQVLDLDQAREPALFAAAQVSLGVLGVVTEVRMRTAPAYKLKRHTWIEATDDVLADFDAEAAAHRHYEMLVLTHSRYAIVQAIDSTDAPVHNPPVSPEDAGSQERLLRYMTAVPVIARRPIFDFIAEHLTQEEPVIDASYRILSNVRNFRFNEMEYSVPLDAGAACLREILATIDAQRIDVVFPIEYRYVAGDDLWLSMFAGGPRAAISVHQDARFDYRPYFDAVEPIFWKYGGRPHWGKLHSLGAKQLTALYPKFGEFLELREALDPTGRMLNSHLRALFGITA